MKLEQRFSRIQILLKEVLPLISQWDLKAISGEPLNHPWIKKVMTFNQDEFVNFDAKRLSNQLHDSAWISFIEESNQLIEFPTLKEQPDLVKLIGKKKKQHEYKRLHSLLKTDAQKSAVDYGGGMGNLAYFLEKNLGMNVTVFEKDKALIEKGLERSKKLKSNTSFKHIEINSNHRDSIAPVFSELSIGLHTCGNFATDMFRDCINRKTKKIINFGCCYSKIKNDDYNLSSLSDKSIKLNQRALSAATLGFGAVPIEIYNYRLKIMQYKYSFYHLLYHKFDILKFCSMSNARRSLYDKDFHFFTTTNLQKFFPELSIPHEKEIEEFYTSKENSQLNLYFKAYYALFRYIGRLLEAYIICDRALYLSENNYDVKILEVFNPTISPRNKVIIAEI